MGTSPSDPAASPPAPDPATVEVLLDHSGSAMRRQLGTIDSLDSKLIGVFTVASAIIGLAGLAGIRGVGPAAIALLAAAGTAWGAAAFFSIKGLWTVRLDVTGAPDVIVPHLWQDSAPSARYSLLHRASKDYTANRDRVKAKARCVRRALVATAAEISFVAAAVVVAAAL